MYQTHLEYNIWSPYFKHALMATVFNDYIPDTIFKAIFIDNNSHTFKAHYLGTIFQPHFKGNILAITFHAILRTRNLETVCHTHYFKQYYFKDHILHTIIKAISRNHTSHVVLGTTF